MNILIYLVWAGVGAGLAFLYLMVQRWSAQLIHPAYPKLSKWLVVGGAVIRWIVVFSILLIALSVSIIAMLIVFLAFMTARLLILIKWQGLLYANR